MFHKKSLDNSIIVLISFIPISILLGSAISVSNIIIISLLSVFLIINKNLIGIFKDQIMVLLLLLLFYLLINSLIAEDLNITLKRNIGFIRFILFFLFINYIFYIYDKSKINYIYLIWTVILIVVLFDVNYEFYSGKNIFGFTSDNKKRIVSFFKDENIVGSFINGFVFIIFGYLIQRLTYNNTNKYKFFLFTFILIASICMILTGERSNTIKYFIAMIIFFSAINQLSVLKKIQIFLSILIVFLVIVSNSTKIKHRYINDMLDKLNSSNVVKEHIYFSLYKTGLNIFKENLYFGVGNKNFRVIACEKKLQKDIELICNTHPHQIYIEFLSEHGLFGTLIILSILFTLIFKNITKIYKKNNTIQLGCLVYMIVQFIPLLPSGSFFSDFNLTFFMLNFSIYFASTNETNIFKKNFSKLKISKGPLAQ